VRRTKDNSKEPLVELDPGKMVGMFGVNWRQLPMVYASCNLQGTHEQRQRTYDGHFRIATELCPLGILLSPLRSNGALEICDGRVGSTSPLNSLTRPEIRARDLKDVARSRVVMLDLEAHEIEYDVLEREDRIGATPKEHRLIRAGSPPGYQAKVLGQVTMPAPFTGSVVECYEAYRLGIPVVAYNAPKRTPQSYSPWFGDFFTKVLDTEKDAIEYVRRNWLV
jgi:hypothetical protein